MLTADAHPDPNPEPPSDADPAAAELVALRAQIDQLDDQLIQLLRRRFDVTTQVGAVKRRYDLQPVDAEREAQQQLRYDALAIQHGLDPAFVRRVFRVVIDEVVSWHRQPD